jgi:8-oxo-dGTP diphosphatase
VSIKDAEATFLATYDAGAFERPSVAVDVALLTVDSGQLRAAVYQRTAHPGMGTYALPGGFVRMDESLGDAAQRVLKDKLGLGHVFIEQLYTFGSPGRDPRTRILSVAHYALVAPSRFDALEESGAQSGRVVVDWSGETGGPASVLGDDGEAFPLFLDHQDVLGVAVQRIRGKLDYAPVGFQLLPDSFTLRQLQEVHEAVREESVNKDSFRRRMLASGQLHATGERQRNVSNRPAELYRFNRRSAV